MEGKTVNSGCILYYTYNLTGLIPNYTNLSNKLLSKPTDAATLLYTTGPSYLWSPTKITCLAPLSIGNKHSGSIAYVASSINIYKNLISFNLLSAEPIQVVQITSAFSIISFSASSLILIKTYSSLPFNSP